MSQKKMVYDESSGTATVVDMTALDYLTTAVHPNESAVGAVKVVQAAALGVAGASLKTKQILGTFNPLAKA